MINFLSETGTVDELGIGIVRDVRPFIPPNFLNDMLK